LAPYLLIANRIWFTIAKESEIWFHASFLFGDLSAHRWLPFSLPSRSVH
jgi:hypothetical protein